MAIRSNDRISASNVLEFASNVAEVQKLSDFTTQRTLLYRLMKKLSAPQRAEFVRELCDTAEGFRRADAVGHEPWYAYHLQVAARAVELLEECQ